MEAAKDVVRRAIDTANSQSDCELGPKQADKRRAAAVWRGLTEIFGTSFLTIHGEEPSRYWLGEIAKLSDDQCRKGLERVIGLKREYPVNLTEFVEACTPKHGSPTFLGVPIDPKTLSLPRPKTNRAHVDGCLARMRRAVGQGSEA